MKLKYLFSAMTAFSLVLAFFACASPPTAEMENARDAVFRAENDPDAAVYGTSSLNRAREALRRMEDEADAKRYDSAKSLAEEAIAAADKAISDGRAGAARAAQESASLVNGLRAEIDETARNVNGARYSELNLDYDALENGIKNAHDKTDRAEASYANGDYQDALDTARTVRADLADINNQISGAIPRSK